jgi:hypothetical protein
MKLSEVWLIAIRKLKSNKIYNVISFTILTFLIFPFIFGTILGTNLINVYKASVDNIGNEKALLLFNSSNASDEEDKSLFEKNYKITELNNQEIVNTYLSEGVKDSFDMKAVFLQGKISDSETDQVTDNYALSLVLLPKEALADGVLQELSTDEGTINILANGFNIIHDEGSVDSIQETKIRVNDLIGSQFTYDYNTNKPLGIENTTYPAKVTVNYAGIGHIPAGNVGGQIGILENDIDQKLINQLPDDEIENAFRYPVEDIGRVLIFDTVESKQAFVKKYNLFNPLDEDVSTELFSTMLIVDMVLPHTLLKGLGFDLDTASELLMYYSQFGSLLLLANILFIIIFFIYDYIKTAKVYSYLLMIGVKRINLIQMILLRNGLFILGSIILAATLSFPVIFALDYFLNIYYQSVALSITNFNNLSQFHPFNLDYTYLAQITSIHFLGIVVLSAFSIFGLYTINLKKKLN